MIVNYSLRQGDLMNDVIVATGNIGNTKIWYVSDRIDVALLMIKSKVWQKQVPNKS